MLSHNSHLTLWTSESALFLNRKAYGASRSLLGKCQAAIGMSRSRNDHGKELHGKEFKCLLKALLQSWSPANKFWQNTKLPQTKGSDTVQAATL